MNSPSLILFSVVCLASSIAMAEKPEPSAAQRRKTIQRELDRNHEAIHVMYSVLESIPSTEPDHRRYVESQIEEFDARNNVLFDEVDALDREQFKVRRREQLRAHANRLNTKAARTDSAKSPVKPLEAKLLEDAIAGDRWEEFLDGTWPCLLYTSPSPRDQRGSRMPSSA